MFRVLEMALRCFLVHFIIAYYLVAGQTTDYFLLGKTASFIANIKETPDEILWKHDGNKVVEFAGSEQLSFGSFEDRVTLDWHSADMTIGDLRYEDSGLYELETFTKNKLDRKRFQIEVIDKVAKPTISCKMSDADTSDQSGGQATLTCSSPSKYHQSLLKFQWRSNANMHLGPELLISLGGELDKHMYNCTVSNPLTQDSATFNAKDCYPDTMSPALIAAIVVAILLFFLIFGLIFWILYKKVCSKREKKSDMENRSPSGMTKEVPSDSEESQALLGRAPTLPSKQTLSHLDQRNDDALSDPTDKGQNRVPRKIHIRNSEEVYMNELRKSLQQRSSSDSEKNINQDSEMSSPSPAPDESPHTVSDAHAKENGRAYEAEPRNAEEENDLEDDPSDPEMMNAALTAEAAEHDDKLQMNADEPGNDTDVKKADPADSENGKDELSGISDHHNPDENKDEDNRASSPPEVLPKSNLAREFSALRKATDGNMPPKVVRKQVLDNPPDSGNPSDELAAGSDNQKDEWC